MLDSLCREASRCPSRVPRAVIGAGLRIRNQGYWRIVEPDDDAVLAVFFRWTILA